jgi:hypothetical protein
LASPVTLSKDERKEIARLGGLARWKKMAEKMLILWRRHKAGCADDLELDRVAYHDPQPKL